MADDPYSGKQESGWFPAPTSAMQPLADGVRRLRLTVLLARRPGELIAELANVNRAHHGTQASDPIDEARAGEGCTDLIDAMERINL